MASRRSHKLIASCAVASAFAAASAHAASAADVTVYPVDGSPKTMDIGGLSGRFDINDLYRILQSNGSSTDLPIQGISVNKLLTIAGADGAYAKVDVVAGGRTVRLSRAQVESATSQLPVVYEAGGQAAFVRPSYSAGDANGADQLTGGSIEVRQVKGPAAKGTVSSKKAKVRQRLTFRASVSNAEPGQKFTYSWVFSDGKTATGATVNHAFKTQGRHTALLTAKVVGEDISINGGVVEVTVGKRVNSDKQRTGGGKNENAGAPTSGSANGDSGAGDQAATDGAKKTTKRKKKTEQPDTTGLERVTGELLSSSTPLATPLQSTLAARSGQQVADQANGFGISGEAAAGVGALLLLGGGVLYELGYAGAFVRRFRP